MAVFNTSMADLASLCSVDEKSGAASSTERVSIFAGVPVALVPTDRPIFQCPFAAFDITANAPPPLLPSGRLREGNMFPFHFLFPRTTACPWSIGVTGPFHTSIIASILSLFPSSSVFKTFVGTGSGLLVQSLCHCFWKHSNHTFQLPCTCTVLLQVCPRLYLHVHTLVFDEGGDSFVHHINHIRHTALHHSCSLAFLLTHTFRSLKR